MRGLVVVAIWCVIGLSRAEDGGHYPEFYFARLAFGAYGAPYGAARSEPWLRDWPEADFHFTRGLGQLTCIATTDDNRQVRLDAESLFDDPIVYAVKVGFMRLGEREAERLREYLLRGGFLIVDDFHGPGEWAEFAASVARVSPERPTRDVSSDDQLFHVLYDLERIPASMLAIAAYNNSEFRFPASRQFAAVSAGSILKAGCRLGAAFTTIMAGCSSRSISIWTSATPGSMPTTRFIPSCSRRSPIGSASTTSSMQ